MSEQMALLYRRTDPHSSAIAARRAEPKASSDGGIILALLRRRRGAMKAREIAEAVGIEAYTVRKRTADLRRAGYAVSIASRYGDRELLWRAL